MKPYKVNFMSKSKNVFKNKIKNRWKNWIISASSYGVFYFLLDLWILTIQKCSALDNDEMGSMNITHPKVLLLPFHKLESISDGTQIFDDVEDSIPLSFDARTKWNNCTSIGTITNQGSCKSGWAIAVASVITDRICIQKGETQIDLSAQNLLACCDNCCGCAGGKILNAWEYVKTEGLVTGGYYASENGCQPYRIRPCNGKKQNFDECGWRTDIVPTCYPTKCTSGTINRLFGSRYRKKHIATSSDANGLSIISLNDPVYRFSTVNDYVLLSRVDHMSIMKELYYNGPVQVSMHLYDDLRWHVKGSYMHVAGHFDGDHAVKLIGWDENSNWLLINSFGQYWGQEGTFLVPRDHEKCNCNFGFAIVAPQINGTITFLENDAIPLRISYQLHISFVMLILFSEFVHY